MPATQLARLASPYLIYVFYVRVVVLCTCGM